MAYAKVGQVAGYGSDVGKTEAGVQLQAVGGASWSPRRAARLGRPTPVPSAPVLCSHRALLVLYSSGLPALGPVQVEQRHRAVRTR